MVMVGLKSPFPLLNVDADEDVMMNVDVIVNMDVKQDRHVDVNEQGDEGEDGEEGAAIAVSTQQKASDSASSPV